jgi:hypothetical protein
MTRATIAEFARRYKAGTAADQWGWRIREHLGPLLRDPKVGEVLTEYILKPLLRGDLPDFERKTLIGGRLYAIPKKSGSISPILVGDSDRRLVGAAMMKRLKPSLYKYLLASHNRVAQVGVGVPDGGVRCYKAIQSLLPAYPYTRLPDDDIDLTDPHTLHCVLSLDAENAFNSMSRTAIFDAVCGQASRAYDCGAIQPGDPLPSPDQLQEFLGYLETHYLDAAQLTYLADGLSFIIEGLQGVQQGDPAAAGIYAVGQHPILIRVATRFPRVFIIAYADNIFLLGSVEQCLACAADLKMRMREDLDLNIQPKSSWIHVPAWAHLPYPPMQYKEILERFPDLGDLPLSLHGEIIVGVPFGTSEYCREQATKIATEILDKYKKIEPVPDGRIHFQLVRFCLHTKFQYLLRCLPPHLCEEITNDLDTAAFTSLMQYGGWPDLAEPNPPSYQLGKLKLSLPHRHGGFGVTKLQDIAPSAYYTATASFLRWMTTDLPSLPAFWSFQYDTAHLRTSQHPLIAGMVLCHDQLLALGAEEIREPVPSQAGAAEASQSPRTLQIPHLDLLCPSTDITNADNSRDKIPPVQPQRIVSAFMCARTPANTRAVAAALANPNFGPLLRAQLQQETSATGREEHSDFAPEMENLRVGKDTKLQHSPLSWLSQFDRGWYTVFPKHLWQIFFCSVTGAPNPDCAAAIRVDKHCRCGQPLDPGGHHLQCCKSHGATTWTAVHNNIQKVWSDCSELAGTTALSNRRDLPRPTTDDRFADIHFVQRLHGPVTGTAYR